MKRNDLVSIVLVAIVAGVISYFVAGAVFNPTSHRTKVQKVESIDASFPDVKNDTAYKAIFNTDALDPTQPIQIGNTNNSTPFQ